MFQSFSEWLFYRDVKEINLNLQEAGKVASIEIPPLTMAIVSVNEKGNFVVQPFSPAKIQEKALKQYQDWYQKQMTEKERGVAKPIKSYVDMLRHRLTNYEPIRRAIDSQSNARMITLKEKYTMENEFFKQLGNLLDRMIDMHTDPIVLRWEKELKDGNKVIVGHEDSLFKSDLKRENELQINDKIAKNDQKIAELERKVDTAPKPSGTPSPRPTGAISRTQADPLASMLAGIRRPQLNKPKNESFMSWRKYLQLAMDQYF